MWMGLITSQANGATGSFVYDGTNYNYSVQSNDVNSSDDYARFAINNYTLLTLNQPISGFTIAVIDIDQPFGEILRLELDGVVFDLNVALANGDVSIEHIAFDINGAPKIFSYNRFQLRHL